MRTTTRTLLLITFFAVLLTTAFTPLAATTDCAPGTYTVSVGSARVRATPSTSARQITSLRSGASVQVTEGVRGDAVGGNTLWCEVTANGRVGYVHSSLITAGGASAGTTQQTNNVQAQSQTLSSPTPGDNTVIPQATAVPDPIQQQSVIPQQPAGGACPSTSYTCSQLATCQQARACLAAGNGRLDRDGDGTPCESLCGG